MENIIKFKVGESYSTRSICDYDCVYTIKVIKRTAKFITFEEHGEISRKGIQIWDGVEVCKFAGSYSMCPVVKADKPTEAPACEQSEIAEGPEAAAQEPQEDIAEPAITLAAGQLEPMNFILV